MAGTAPCLACRLSLRSFCFPQCSRATRLSPSSWQRVFNPHPRPPTQSRRQGAALSGCEVTVSSCVCPSAPLETGATPNPDIACNREIKFSRCCLCLSVSVCVCLWCSWLCRRPANLLSRLSRTRKGANQTVKVFAMYCRTYVCS